MDFKNQKENSERAVQILQRYNLKSLSSSINAEKTVVSHDEIEEYIRILLEQFSDVSIYDKNKLKKIKDCSDELKFEINFEERDKFKIYLFRVVKLEFQFEIEIYSYKHEIKLSSISSLWRQLFGESDSLILSELSRLFGCKNDLLVFIIQQACNIDLDNNNIDCFNKRILSS